MKRNKTIRILALLSIVCVLGFGLYANFSSEKHDATTGRTVMVFKYE